MTKTFDELFPTVKPVGLCHVTGPSGVGKSLFAIGLIAEGLDPKRIAVFDCEQSLAVHHAQLGFGAYYDLVAMSAKSHGLTARPYHLFQLTLALTAELKSENFDLVVVDNISPLEEAIQDEVEANPAKYGLSMGQLDKTALKWGPIKRLEARFAQMLANIAPLYIFTSQLRSVFAGGQPVPGLFRPRGKQDVLEHQTFLRLWLEHRIEGPEPGALVLKSRLVRPQSLDGKISWQPLLPPRLPLCTWGEIRGYFASPPDPDHLAPNERLTDADWYKLRGTLSPDQLEIFRLMAQQSAEPITPKEPELPRTPAEFIMGLGRLGLSLQEALEKLGKELPNIEPADDYAKLQLLAEEG